MNYVVRSINLFSVVKISFILFFLLGILLDVVYLLIIGLPQSGGEYVMNSLIVERMGIGDTLLLLGSFAVAFGSFIALFSGVGILLYNLASGAMGGVSVNLKTENLLDTETVTHIKTPLNNSGIHKEASESAEQSQNDQ